MRLPTTAAFALVLLTHFLEANAAENWPQWRGPGGAGVGADGDYPVKFSGSEGAAWKVALPGKGSSTPAVWGDRIFVTCAIDGQDGVVCYDMQGKELWRKQLGKERPGKHRNGSGSNPSPVTDGQNVVVYYKSGTLANFTPEGKALWKLNVQDRFGEDTLWWDLGTSPVIVDKHAILAVVQGGEAYLAAFNLDSGDTAWITPRQYEVPEECDNSYSTPQVANVGGKNVIVTWGADHLTGHDADSGKLLWECGGFNPQNQINWRTIASPTVSNGVAVVPYGRGTFLAGVRIDGGGDITKSARLWENTERGQSTDVPSPVIDGDRVYVLNDTGKISCLDLHTGKARWSADLPRNRAKFYASPVLAGDKLYCVREDGAMFVGQVTDGGFKQLAENDIGEHVIATPVPIRGGLLVRGEENLYMFGPAEKSARK
jgi:outer membrane protein assembly factor BamB